MLQKIRMMGSSLTLQGHWIYVRKPVMYVTNDNMDIR